MVLYFAGPLEESREHIKEEGNWDKDNEYFADVETSSSDLEKETSVSEGELNLL